MKRIACIAACCIALVIYLPLQAQLVVVNYMKVKPENIDKYVAFEATWKKVHEARQMAGNMVEWRLYRKEFGGADDPYQYITVNIFKSLNDYFSEDWNAINKWLPDMDQNKLDELSARTEEIRTIGATHCFFLDAATNNRIVKPSEFVQIEFMRTAPGRQGDYVKGEKEIFMPMHQEMARQKMKDGWELWQKSFGSNLEFDYITANYYGSIDQWGKGDPEAILKKTHPGKSIASVQQWLNCRTIIASEIWRLVDYLPAVSK